MSQARTGTITRLAKDRWRLQVTPEPDPLTGQRKRLSKTVRGTQTEARHALQRFIDGVGARLAAETNTIASLLGAYMATATLAATTRTDWQSLTDRHINPAIGIIRLDRLQARDCDEFYTRLRVLGLGPSRVRCAHVVLHRSCAQAVRWGWLTNPRGLRRLVSLNHQLQLDKFNELILNRNIIGYSLNETCAEKLRCVIQRRQCQKDTVALTRGLIG